MLAFHTHMRQDQIVLARSMRAVQTVVRGERFLNNHPTFRGLFKIEVVQPSASYREALRRAEAERERAWLRGFLCYHAVEYRKRFKVLPEGFSPCRKYRAKYEDMGRDREHDHCANCVRGVNVARHRFLELYRTSFHTALLRRSMPSVFGVHSRAPEADPARPLYKITRGSGMTRDVGMHEVKPKVEWLDDALFYYQIIEALPCTELEAIVAAHQRAYESKQKATSTQREIFDRDREDRLLRELFDR